MTNFKIFNGNENEFDTRTEPVVHQEWDIGVGLVLANFDDDVRIFTPRFNFRGMLAL